MDNNITTKQSDDKGVQKDSARRKIFFWVVVALSLFHLVGAFIVGGGYLGIIILWAIALFVIKQFAFDGKYAWWLAIVTVVLVMTFSVFVLPSRDGSGDSAKNTEPLPNLEMTVVKSPEIINCDDELSTIEVTATNVGKKDLTFAEVQDGKYDFGICDAIKEDGLSHCFPASGNYLSVNDFGIIKIGETKQIIFTTPKEYDNAITSFSNAKVNGEYEYYIDFVQIKNPKLKPILSESTLFTVQTNIMNPANEYIKADCRKKK